MRHSAGGYGLSAKIVLISVCQDIAESDSRKANRLSIRQVNMKPDANHRNYHFVCKEMHVLKQFLRWIACLAVFMIFSSVASSELLLSAPSCDVQACPIPTVNESNQPVYAIVFPAGYHAVDMISQAPRLDTLSGKKIALVGGSFMASITHDELKLCIQENYPTAEVYMFQTVGSGGPYSVFGQSQQ